jgi:hypothetical protein
MRSVWASGMETSSAGNVDLAGGRECPIKASWRTKLAFVVAQALEWVNASIRYSS